MRLNFKIIEINKQIKERRRGRKKRRGKR